MAYTVVNQKSAVSTDTLLSLPLCSGVKGRDGREEVREALGGVGGVAVDNAEHKASLVECS